MTLPPPDQQSIREAIAREESRSLRIEKELGGAEARLAAFNTALARADSPEKLSSRVRPPSGPSTPAEKVALSRSRFRGRGDVYPRFWNNVRTGRKGYAPACANERIRGVCEKPRVRCGECSNQAFTH
jgi:hypothetical protein